MSERRIHLRAAPPTLRLREDGGPPTLVGHAAVFDRETVIYQGRSYVSREVIRPGAFARALRENQNVVANFNHSDSHVLGRSTSGTLRMREDGVGLAVEIDLPDTTLGRDVAELVRRGDLSGMSFAFIPTADGGERTTIETVDGVDQIFTEVLDCDLFDVSAVTWPAYPQTDLNLRAERLLKDHLAEVRRKLLAPRRERLATLKARMKP